MNPPLSNQAQADYQQAQALLAAKGKSFYWASQLLGAVHARRAARLYRFCRYLDDLVDEAASADAAQVSLNNVKAALVAGKSDDALVEDALSLIKECSISPDAVIELINGVNSDLETVRIADEAALLRYCYRVAGTVGIMMCAVLDVRSEAALPHAIDLGIAMQITNICRDVAEDASMGRIYLPASLIGEINPDDLILPTREVAAKVEQALTILLSLAESFYASGMAGLSFLPLGARSGISVAAQIYREIGLKLKRAGYVYWKNRTVVSNGAKAVITVRSLVSNVVKPAFWRVVAPHDVNLHKALQGFPFAHAAEMPLNG